MDRYKLQILTAVRAVLLPAINDLNLVKKRIVVIFFEFAKMTVYLKKRRETKNKNYVNRNKTMRVEII